MDGAGAAEAEGLLLQGTEELNQRYGPPPGYDEHVEGAVASRRCMMMPVAADVEDAALALVVQADRRSALAGLDSWAGTSVIRRSLVKPGWRVRRRDTTSVDGPGSIGEAGVNMGEDVEVPV